jgi:hypothetical protein
VTFGISLFRYAATCAARWPTATASGRRPTWSSAGPGGCLLDEEVHELHEWDVVRVAPEVVRAFEAGPDGLDVIAVGGPKPPDGDGVMGSATWPESQ